MLSLKITSTFSNLPPESAVRPLNLVCFIQNLMMTDELAALFFNKQASFIILFVSQRPKCRSLNFFTLFLRLPVITTVQNFSSGTSDLDNWPSDWLNFLSGGQPIQFPCRLSLSLPSEALCSCSSCLKVETRSLRPLRLSIH